MEIEESAPLVPMLYLCATPIGNMEDITLRAVRVLGAVSAVYCEDTRRTGALLSRLGIKKPLVSCRAQNENARAAEIVSRVKAGEAVAYASDAGMPGISDPGERLVAACVAILIHLRKINCANSIKAKLFSAFLFEYSDESNA